MFSCPPIAWQFKLVVGVNHLHDGFVQQVFTHVFQVQPGNLAAAQPLDGLGGLTRSQIAAIAEQRRDDPHPQILKATVRPGQGPEQLVQVQPALGIYHDIHDADRFHPFGDQGIDASGCLQDF